MNNWLSDAGLVLKLGRVEKPTLPLNAYADMDVFKLFLLGIGLLNALTRLDPKILLEKKQYFDRIQRRTDRANSSRNN